VIPKVHHFCFGLPWTGGDWGLVHYVFVKSAVERIRPKHAFLYFEHRPRGPFWYRTAKIMYGIKITALRTIFGNPLNHSAHCADVPRLQKRIEIRGIYLDCDVFVYLGFHDLLDNSVALGQDGSTELVGHYVVILAAPNARALFYPHWDDEGIGRLFASTDPIPSNGVYVNQPPLGTQSEVRASAESDSCPCQTDPLQLPPMSSSYCRPSP